MLLKEGPARKTCQCVIVRAAPPKIWTSPCSWRRMAPECLLDNAGYGIPLKGKRKDEKRGAKDISARVQLSNRLLAFLKESIDECWRNVRAIIYSQHNLHVISIQGWKELFYFRRVNATNTITCRASFNTCINCSES